MSALFAPIALGPITLANRIVVAPMAQYSAENGCFSDWHLSHLGTLAGSGAALVTIELTSVTPEGVCTPGDPGLYDDATEAALARVVAHMRKCGTAKVGIQLGHGGRKASTQRFWEGGKGLTPEQGGWPIVAPSAIAFADNPQPSELTLAQIAALIAAFAESAKRAVRAGVEVIELHAAHGYLLHQFHSPITNQRSDAYGGSPENRRRFLLEVFAAVRQAAPGIAVGIRATASDWIEGGSTGHDLAELAKALEPMGCDFIDVTSGGIDPAQKITVGPLYQVDFAAALKAQTSIPVRAVGLIVTPEQAEAVIAEGKADMVALGRGFLANPHWAWAAAHRLGAEISVPLPYQRAGTKVWAGWSMA